MCIRPMLARIGSQSDLDREGFIFEPKIDGIRATCRKQDGLTFFNRSCRDVSTRYPEFDFAESLAAETCVLDGEIVLYDRSGNPDFTALMQRHLGTSPIRRMDRAVRYAVFDILKKDGRDLTKRSLRERKDVLREVVGRHPHLEFVVYTDDGHRLWEFIERRSLEGVVAKDPAAHYRPGQRSSSWLKIKAFQTIDAVIVGYTDELRAVSALALAAFAGGELQFIGKVGTGFSAEDIRMLKKLLAPIERDAPPLDVPAGYRNINWVEPKLACEVRYLEFGKQGMLRNPSFIRLRPDKSIKECRLEEQQTA